MEIYRLRGAEEESFEQLEFNKPEARFDQSFLEVSRYVAWDCRNHRVPVRGM